MCSSLLREPGWLMLQRAFSPEIRVRISDQNSKEAFMYEAIRSQVIQEIFSMPQLIIDQAERERLRHPVNHNASPADDANSNLTL